MSARARLATIVGLVVALLASTSSIVAPRAGASTDQGDPNDDVHAFGVERLGDTRFVEPAAPTVGIAATSDGDGYWLAGSDGGVFDFGTAEFHGSLGDIELNQPIVAIAADPTGGGFWLAASDGGVFTFGDAEFHGSLGDLVLDQPIVGMAAHPDGTGYWLVASDGGVFTFGEAEFLGSMGGIPLNRPVVGMAATPSGDGYWLVASDGGIFTFGDAEFHGSTGAIDLDEPIVAMSATTDADGYWMVASDGGVFTFGTADYLGSAAAIDRDEPVVAMATAPDGSGYWLARRAGPRWPLTDLPADAVHQRPALAVKIDNHPSARGQWGLAQADIVFEELVEGGVTRFVAVFHSTPASPVGPIRSARETDVALLPMFGRSLLVYSGGNRTVRGIVDESELVHGVLPDSEHFSAYYRTSLRRNPHNLMSRTHRLWPFATDDMGAPPAVFDFREPVLLAAPTAASDDPVASGDPLVVDFGTTTVRWTWDDGRFVRSHGRFAHRDAHLDRVTATNIVVLEVDYVESPATGSPATTALGAGRGVVLVDGIAVDVTWTRSSFTDRFDLRRVDTGAGVLLAPGRTWVELVPEGLAPFDS